MPEVTTQPGATGDPAANTLEGGKGDDPKGFKAPTTQEEFDGMIKDRIDRLQGTHTQELDQLKQQIKDLEQKGKAEPKGEKSPEKTALELQIETMQKQFDELQAEKQKADDAIKRAQAVKAEKLDPEWADLIAGDNADQWAENAKKVNTLVQKLIKQRNAPDTNTGNSNSRGPRGQQKPGEIKFRPRTTAKQVTVPST